MGPQERLIGSLYIYLRATGRRARLKVFSLFSLLSFLSSLFSLFSVLSSHFLSLFWNHVFYDVRPQLLDDPTILCFLFCPHYGVLSTSQNQNAKKIMVFWCGPFSNPVFYDVWPQKTSKRLCLFDADPSHYGVLSTKPPQSLPKASQSIPKNLPAPPSLPKAFTTLPQKNNQNEKKITDDKKYGTFSRLFQKKIFLVCRFGQNHLDPCKF